MLMEEDQGEYPDSLLHHFPSQLRLDALPHLVDASVSRTLLTSLLAALKANGLFACVLEKDRERACVCACVVCVFHIKFYCCFLLLYFD